MTNRISGKSTSNNHHDKDGLKQSSIHSYFSNTMRINSDNNSIVSIIPPSTIGGDRILTNQSLSSSILSRPDTIEAIIKSVFDLKGTYNNL